MVSEVVSEGSLDSKLNDIDLRRNPSDRLILAIILLVFSSGTCFIRDQLGCSYQNESTSYQNIMPRDNEDNLLLLELESPNICDGISYSGEPMCGLYN